MGLLRPFWSEWPAASAPTSPQERSGESEPLGVEQLVEQVNLSPRQFSRIFTAETGQSPAKAIEALRLEAARVMLEQGRHPVEVMARENGFRDRRHLREAYLLGFGVAPNP